MSDLNEFLDQLDAADDDERERHWIGAAVGVTTRDLQHAVAAGRPCARWLSLRHSAGPPGTTLPAPAGARQRVLRGEGSPADAYAAVMLGPPVAVGSVVDLLVGAWRAAHRAPGSWLAPWLVSRAIIAAYALGEAQRAWKLLDSLDQRVRLHPELERVTVLEPIRGVVDLESSVWVRASLCWMWGFLAVPAVPALPIPVATSGAGGPPLPELDRLGAVGLFQLVARFQAAIQQHQARELARPRVVELRRAVERAATRLGDPRLLAVADVERAVSAIGPLDVDEAVVEMSLDGTHPVLEGLLLALVLLGAAEAGSIDPLWRFALQRYASNAILRLGVVRLLELRIRLLCDMLATPDPPTSVAELHYQRANSRRALDLAECTIIRDLESAAELARTEDNADTLADATALLGRVYADRDQPEQPADLLQRLDAVLQLPISPERQALVLQAKSALLRPVDPASAAAHAGQAVALLAHHDPHRVEVGAEQVLALVESGSIEEALVIARGLLTAATASTSRTVTGMVHHALGYALEAARDWQAARTEYERALSYTRGVDFRNEVINRLQLAGLALLTGDEALWEQQHSLLQERSADLKPWMRQELAMLVAEAARRGQMTTAEASAVLADESASIPSWERVCAELQLARLALASGEPADLEPLMRQAIHHLDRRDVRWLALELAHNHGGDLSGDLLNRLVEAAREDSAPATEARLLARLGRISDARHVLEQALARELSTAERLAALHQLITLMGDDQREERLGHCRELEALLAELPAPGARIDLAACYRLLALEDRALLDRAWTHGTRALNDLVTPHERQHAHRVVALTLMDLTKVAACEADAEVVERARWLLDELPLAPGELAKMRRIVAHHLLALGPLCLPEAVDIAAALLDKAAIHQPAPEAVTSLCDRLAWIRDVTSSRPVGAVPPREPHGPADELPRWLVRVVAGVQERLPAPEVEPVLDFLPLVLRLRPDTSDRVLAPLVRMQGAWPESARDQLFAVMRQQVAGPYQGPGAWTELQRALRSLKPSKRPKQATSIENEIQRSRDGVVRIPATNPTRRARSREDAFEAFEDAITIMGTVHQQPFDPQASSRIRHARELLSDAVRVARRKRLPQLTDFLISLGNAWKMPPNEDVERALGIYQQVARRDLRADQLAKLQKVQGDALRHRGRPDDLREAFDLLQLSAKARSGWLRAESLLNAAGVARMHPDFDEDEQIIRAVELYVDAVRADAEHVGNALAGLLPFIGEWVARRPSDSRPAEIRAELKRRYPERASKIDQPSRLPSPTVLDQLETLFASPALTAYLGVASRLMPPPAMPRPPQGMEGLLDAEAFSRGLADLASANILGNVERLREELAGLDRCPVDVDATPGVALARVHLLAELCRAGGGSIEDVRRSSTIARMQHEAVSNPKVAAFLYREHARIWCPRDHHDDPVRDFALAASLSRRAIDLEGGLDHAITDSVELLARSLRYSPEGDVAGNLIEARHLYAVVVERVRGEGNGDALANALLCLAEAESQSAEGDRLSRLSAGVRTLELAVRSAVDPHKRAQVATSLAWQKTLLALQLPGAEHVEGLREALLAFDEIESEHLIEPHERRSHLLNRAVCHSALERATKGSAAAVAVWRKELDLAEVGAPSHHAATIRHNLANAILAAQVPSREDLLEALDLCERAVRVRTLVANPRHHWETAFLAGSALASSLSSPGRAAALPWPAAEAWQHATRWLRKAIDAARALGAGEELAAAADALASLARSAPTVREGLDVAEEAWSALQAAAPYLLLHAEHAQREAWRALDVALWVAWSLAREGVSVTVPGVSFALDGVRAEMVLKWLVRGFAPLQRGVHARLQRPEDAGGDQWADWVSALASRTPARVVDALKSLHAEAPGFLGGEVDLGPTWRWLRAHPGAVAVSVLLAEPYSIALVLAIDSEGRHRARVLGLPTGTAPVEGDVLWSALSETTNDGSEAAQVHDAMANWARKRIAQPVLQYLSETPTGVLWCPGQSLRLVAPMSLWEGIPVALSASPALADHRTGPIRGRSTLLLLADPGQGPLELGAAATAVMRRLAAVSAERGDVSMLASVGRTHGALPLGVRALSGPASPTNLVRRALDHDVFVVVAHGEAPSPEQASLLLIGGGGELQRLDVPALAASDEAFVGATVLLLACESGRVGERFHEPGGVAGALIAAGARLVVAPLWPVRLDVASAVCEAVLLGLTNGEEPFEVLANLPPHGLGGPLLGPAPDLASQEQASRLQRLAFVSWVG